MCNNALRWAFQHHPTLQKLTQIQIEKIVTKIETKSFNQGDVVFSSGTKLEKLVVVLEGSLEMSGKEIALKGGMYGDQSLSSAKNYEYSFLKHIGSRLTLS
jgi:cGMP-dependent protein kinase 1